LKAKLKKQESQAELKLNSILLDCTRQLSEVTQDMNKIKIQEVNNELSNELRNALITEQKLTLKKQLTKLDVECNILKMKLEKEVSYLYRCDL
jgi:hypothetical protein